MDKGTCNWGRERLSLAVAVLVLAGCGGGQSADGVTATDYGKIRGMTAMYVQYMGAHGGKAPADEQAFRQFLETKQDMLERQGVSVDDMFESPRTGGAMEWVYGKAPPSGEGGIRYVGYEKEPTDGKRLVIGTPGIYEVLDDAQFHRMFPDAQ